MKNKIKDRWESYAQKKTKAGIVFDILFVLFFIAMLIPTSRKAVSSFIIHYTMMAPKEESNAQKLSDDDYQWRYRDMEGEAINFEELKGKVIVLNFWATWCPPCVAELPSIQKLYEDFGEKVEFVLISDEENFTIKSFFRKKGYDLPVYHPMDQVPEALYSRSLPTTFVISKDGRIVMSKKGAANWHGENVINLLNQLIEE
jgi:thiol-disulfide isomerase/thioredoxin